MGNTSNDAMTMMFGGRLSSASLAARPIDRDGRDLGRPETLTGRLFVTGERALDEGQFEAARAAFRQHGAQVLRSALDVERQVPGSPPLSILAIAAPRTFSTFGPPDVSDKRSITR